MKLEFVTQILGDVMRKVSRLSIEGKESIVVYVEIPLQYAENIPVDDDAGLILMLHYIMQHEGTCCIHGKIHKTLLAIWKNTCDAGPDGYQADIIFLRL